jgi:acetyl esterase/lipase
MSEQTYTFPPAWRELGKILEEAGIQVAYGPNPTPVPEVLSEEASRAWLALPQLPLPAANPKQLAAMRQVTAIGENAVYEQLRESYSIEDAVINGITTMWITPPQLSHPDKAMVFVHGGGFVLNTRKTQLALQAAVASKLGVKVASIEYPLAPEHPYPAATDAIVDAYRGVLDQFGTANIGLLGTSAGGGHVLATLLRLKNDGIALPAASVALSPSADMTFSGDSFALVGAKDPILPVQGAIDSFRGYCGNADPRDPLVSPVFGDWTDVTPLFLFAGTRELVWSDASRIAASARRDGCDVALLISDGMWHVSVADGSGVPEEQFAFDQMIVFLTKHLLGTDEEEAKEADSPTARTAS